jgi:hypothetical protein
VSVDIVFNERITECHDALSQLRAQMIERGSSVAGNDRVFAQRIERRRPTAIAPRRAKTAHRLFEHRDLKGWITAQEFAGRPQSGKPAAHDGDIYVQVVTERSTRPYRFRQR